MKLSRKHHIFIKSVMFNGDEIEGRSEDIWQTEADESRTKTAGPGSRVTTYQFGLSVLYVPQMSAAAWGVTLL